MKLIFFYSSIIFIAVNFFFTPHLYPEKTIDEIIFSGLESDKNEKVQHSINYIRSNKPPHYIPKLAGILINSDNQNVRELSFMCLKFYDKKETLAAWTHILENTKSFVTKLQIIDYLSDLDDKRLVIPMAKELAVPFYMVRKKSAVLLKKFGDDRIYPLILSMAENQTPIYRLYALEALHYLYDKRFYPVLMDLLKDGNKSVKIYTIHCLQKNDLIDSIPILRELAINEGNTEIRIEAVNALAYFNDKNSLYAVLKTLYHQNPNLRKVSIEALNKFSIKSSAQQLSTQLIAENDDDNKLNIIELLIRFKSPGDINGLKKILLSDKNSRLRIKSAYALGVIKDERAINILKDGLRDIDFRVRAEAAASLGMYDSKIVSQILIDLIMTDSTRYVKSAALFSLKKQGYKKILLPLYNIFADEKDPVFREMLKKTIIEFINKFI